MNYTLLNQINSPQDLKRLPDSQLNQLCKEIRSFLVESVSKTGGHLASNLGVVELTVALHRVFDCPEDKIIWDVGHQSYVHKLLTGRKDMFDTLRKENGIAGFPRRSESEYDAFIGGHASNSIAAAYGIAKANTLQGNGRHVIAVIGDGALTGGLAYEGINNAGRSKDNLIVILNDNNMSISKNVGAFARYLATIRSKPTYLRAKINMEKVLDKIPVVGKPFKNTLKASKSAVKNMLYHSNLFEDFGFNYYGPIDGHNLEELTDILKAAKSNKGAAFVHVETVKGKGYQYAEENPGAYHGVSAFDVVTGNPDIAYSNSFSSVAGKTLTALADADSRICAITAAMKYGTGLQYFCSAHRDRFFDVGIAEEFGVTFAAGLASNGMIPVFAVYSTFLQRSYDQIIHDAALEKQHIVLAVDRAGIVGDDGETHQGIYDVAFLSTIPGVTILSASSYHELRWMLKRAIYDYEGVVAVRYPRGAQPNDADDTAVAPALFQYQFSGDESSVLLATYGRTVHAVVKAAEKLIKQGIGVSLLKLNQVHPIPEEAVKNAMVHSRVFFFEEGIKNGSAAEQMLAQMKEKGYRGDFHITAIDDQFVKQATIEQALKRLKLDEDSITETVVSAIGQ